VQYDYIIVGAGSGGSSLAGRLADACPDATIALIEAGSHTERNLLVNMPVGIAALVPFKLGTNYGYETVPQPGLGGRRGYQPRGRGMGGSSAINAMIYARPSGRLRRVGGARRDGLGLAGGAAVFPPRGRQPARRRRMARRGRSAHGFDLRFRNPFSERFVQAAHAAAIR
jgi:choline dehydrogenase-like flavoprotein